MLDSISARVYFIGPGNQILFVALGAFAMVTQMKRTRKYAIHVHLISAQYSMVEMLVSLTLILYQNDDTM